MQAFTLSVLPGLAAVVLLAGCGDGDRVVVMRDAAPTAESTFVGQSLPAWHPALPEDHPPVLPEGHPPISGEECPAGGMGGFSGAPASEPSAPETIST